MNKLLITLNRGVRLIKFNNPKKKNAMDSVMYTEIAHVLNEDAPNDDVVATILTGVGDYYSSGKDFTDPAPDKIQFEILRTMVDAFINYPKILISLVNGPAIGIGATSAALCDVVYASDRATFRTPFVQLGFCPEGCSSRLFPQILGKSKAFEVLVLGHELTAREALECGLVARVVPHDRLDTFLQEDLLRYGRLPVNSVKVNKGLIAANYKRDLIECNERECKQLVECVKHEDYLNGNGELVKLNKKKL